MLSSEKKVMPLRRLRVVCHGHPALRRVSSPVSTVTDKLRRLAQCMIITMRENYTVGIGLAAPQVGVNVRLITLDICLDSKGGSNLSPGELLFKSRMPLALVNPEILSFSEHCDSAEEGCLSLPGVSGHVRRPERILLRASSLDGEQFQVECAGLLARCLQHEIDHLDGKLFYEHLNKAEQKAAADTMRVLARRERALMQR